MITYSVFRLAARPHRPVREVSGVGSAPVNEKRVGLKRSPRRQGMPLPRNSEFHPCQKLKSVRKAAKSG